MPPRGTRCSEPQHRSAKFGADHSMKHEIKNPHKSELRGFLFRGSGVDLLSRTVKCNIIGAEAFHGPVRDGKGWFHLAMDTRLKGSLPKFAFCWIGRHNSEEEILDGRYCIGCTAAAGLHRLEQSLVEAYCYRVKPHGQLVSVSLTHCCASTPDLSTSWSRTTLQGD